MYHGRHNGKFNLWGIKCGIFDIVSDIFTKYLETVILCQGLVQLLQVGIDQIYKAVENCNIQPCIIIVSQTPRK